MEEKVISVAEMRAADRYTIEELGVPSKELMRRAAQGVFDAVFAGEDLPEDDVFSTVIFCGSGNNGGDGYALAEIMKDEDLDVTVVRVSEKFSEDGKYYFDRCAEKGVRMMMYEEFLSGIKAMPESESQYDIIVDCMLGTGFSGVPREPIAGAIGLINKAGEDGAFVVAVDINSGMNGDTGEAVLAVKSDLTVSIGYYKHGFFTEEAKKWIGELENADIGITLP
jgi:NAD(P)H-hydrate epimerase